MLLNRGRNALGTSSGGGGAGGSYTAQAIALDGGAVLGVTDQAAGLAAASPLGLLTCWVKYRMSGSGYLAVQNNGPNFDALIGCLGVEGSPGNDWALDPDYNTGQATNNGTNPIPADTWTPLLMAWDMGHSPASRVFQVYYGDAAQTPTIEQNDGDATAACQYQYDTWQFLGSIVEGAAQSGYVGDIADFQMWCGTTADLSNQAVRRLFVDASGKPVDPATAAASLGAPTVLFSGNATSFATNGGDGPATSILLGTLTNAITSPSD